MRTTPFESIELAKLRRAIHGAKIATDSELYDLDILELDIIIRLFFTLLSHYLELDPIN